jgi:hypothetical protein
MSDPARVNAADALDAQGTEMLPAPDQDHNNAGTPAPVLPIAKRISRIVRFTPLRHLCASIHAIIG